MLDEVRHQQVDEIFLAQFYDKTPFWNKKSVDTSSRF